MSRRSVSPSLPMQERVLNCVPSVMTMLISWYSGGMPGFMVWSLADAADPDRPRKPRAIAGPRRRLKTKFEPAPPFLARSALAQPVRTRYEQLLSQPPRDQV